ncbi:MFS transporter [Rhizobium sp. RU36D]|uniref:MFS transporter n=1 Tax=Rhizobium sp. RU36D TaxID=1907415 RepID=UPI0009D7D010|nr:MFS transporter [Rhizobium sp. RU36D]SMC80859.1 MFS transporter, PPP family, 3-phenylpropionic acid transporter [Rhizobium sp. RU36D]
MTAHVPSAFYGAPPAWFRLRSALGFCVPMLTSGVILPFVPVWLKHLGFAEGEIALVLAVPMVAKVLVAPVVAVFADRLKERSTVLVWSAGLSVLLTLCLLSVDSFWVVLLLYSLLQAVFSPYMPVVESVLMTGVRRWGYDYGSMRLWGSLGFVLSTLVAGWVIGHAGADAVMPLVLGGFVLAVASALVVPRTGNVRRPVAIRPSETADAASRVSSREGSLIQLHLQMLLIGACLVQSSHAMLYAFSSIYWQQLGFSGTAIGVLWSGGVVAEVLVFAVSGRLLKRLGPWTMVRFGCAVAVCRWLLFPLPLGLTGYLLLQFTHAFTFAFVHLGIQQRIVEAVGEAHEASAQGNYFFYNGAFMALCTLACGPLYRHFGQSGYLFMAGLAAVGLLVVIAAWYMLPGGPVSGGKRRA